MTNPNTNETEWSNPENWPGGVYRSRIDTRMIVPKRRGIGVTINFGHRKAVLLSVALLAIPLVVITLVFLFGKHSR